MIPASASGLRVTPCRIAPATPSAAPARMPSSVRGTRSLERDRAADRAVVSRSVSARSTSARPMSREPSVTLRNATAASDDEKNGEPRSEHRVAASRDRRSTGLRGHRRVRRRRSDRPSDRAVSLSSSARRSRRRCAARTPATRRPRRALAALILNQVGCFLPRPALAVGVRAAVPRIRVGLVLVGVLPAEVLPVREARVRVGRVDARPGPSSGSRAAPARTPGWRRRPGRRRATSPARSGPAWPRPPP